MPQKMFQILHSYSLTHHHISEAFSGDLDLKTCVGWVEDELHTSLTVETSNLMQA